MNLNIAYGLKTAKKIFNKNQERKLKSKEKKSVWIKTIKNK